MNTFGAINGPTTRAVRLSGRTIGVQSKEFGMDIAAMSCAIEPFGIDMGSAFDTLRDDFDKIVADCKAVGCTILRIGMLQFSYATCI